MLYAEKVFIFFGKFLFSTGQVRKFVLSPVNEIPQGYKTDGPRSRFEEEIWKEFWSIAMDPQKAKQRGIKNAQIEAPVPNSFLGFCIQSLLNTMVACA